jgi:hypothetical protein
MEAQEVSMRARVWLVAFGVLGIAACGSRPSGAAGGNCQPGGACDEGLACVEGKCVSTCGDGWCDTYEDALTCPDDCDGVSQSIFNQSLNNKADILFMIDGSNSMSPKTDSLISYFPNFIQPLKDLPTKPDLHLGIITADLGAGQFTPPSCDTIGGDQGILQNTPKGTTCTSASLTNPTDRFLSYSPDGSGGAAVNFTGDIADAFGCYAAVGDGGCGFEHQLASVRAALDGCETDAGCKQRQNAGFFRKDAYLGVIILTDEDDCSAPSSSTLFDPSQTTLNAALGPLTSYRCFEFGNLCGGTDPGRSQGPRESCVPGNKDPSPAHQLIPTKDVADFLKGLKPQDPRMVYVSVIAGPPVPVAVGLDANGYPDLQPACTGGMGSADPATRLSELVTWFDDDRASFTNVCQPDMSQAMTKIADGLARVLGRQCLSAPLKLDGGRPACVVQDRTTIDSGAGTYTWLSVPACVEVICDPATAPNNDCRCQQHPYASVSSPCWFLWSDEASCPMVDPWTPISSQSWLGSGYQLWIDRGTDPACNFAPPAQATTAFVQCQACDTNPVENRYDCSPGCADYWPACCPSPTPGCFQ